MKISASVYSSKSKDLRSLIMDLDAHGIDYFHIDCNDDPRVFDDIAKIQKWSNTPIDLHLITPNPEAYFDTMNALKIDMVTFQLEELNGYRYQGGLSAKMGLGIVSETDVLAFEDHARHYDFVLMMATTPGKSGGQFDKINFRKVRSFKQAFPDKEIHVDGGVNAEVSFILRNMGVAASVVGSYLFKDQTLGAALLNLKIHDIESQYAVKDFMRSRGESPVLAAKSATLKAVLQSMEEHKLGFTMLTADNDTLAGIISNADLRRALLQNIDHPEGIVIDHMLNKNPITIHENDTVRSMIQKVKAFNFPVNYLPVLDDNNRIAGVVSFLNLVKGEL